MGIRRLAAGAFAVLVILALGSVPALASGTRSTHPKPTAPSQPRKAPAPEIFQVTPAKVDPTVQPNILILGQNLTPASTVVVGGRAATTVQAPDPNHLLVKLPQNLGQGTYTVEVTNEAGTAVATDPLVVEGASGLQLSTLQIVAIAGSVLFLILLMRLSRTPSLA